MYIRNSNFNHNSLNQLNYYSNTNIKGKVYKQYKNSRSKLPVKTVYRNYNFNSNQKLNNNYSEINNERETFYSNELINYNFTILKDKNSMIKNRSFQSLEQLTANKNKPGMNIMINNGIIKNIFVNKNPKYKKPSKTKYLNNINKIKENLYNDYNLTFENINNNTKINNKNYLNIKSASKNIKTFEYKSFNGKKLLQNKQILSTQKYKDISSQRKNSCGNNDFNNIYELYKRDNIIMNKNRKNEISNSNNFYFKTNIYDTNKNNIRDKMCLIPSKVPNKNDIISNTQIKVKKNVIFKHRSFNEANLLPNNKRYHNTDANNNKNIIKNDLISSSSSSDNSQELSSLAEDIINIYKTEKRKNKEKKSKKNKMKNEISKKLIKDFNKPKEKERKKEANESTEENFDLIDEIINKANLEENKKKYRKIDFELEKNTYINYDIKEKPLNNEKNMEFYLTLLKSKIKFNPIIQNFDKKDIGINKDYILNENLEEYELLGDLYNIFYLKDINDLDKKLKYNIDNLVQKA